MHILITGANGFVGASLARRLLTDPAALPGWDRLTLVDLSFTTPTDDPRVQQLVGSLDDPTLLATALEAPAEVVFHLASVPGGLAERDYALGRQANLDATLALLEGLQRQATPARVVFASTIAVYGSPLPEVVDDFTPLRPHLSYATQKLIGELLIDDFSRRGTIDGISLRLPGIVARPPQPSGLLSAFMSDVFWKSKAGEPFECPVSAQATAWWMSAVRCVDNLLHAAALPAEALRARRVFTLPVLHLSMGALIEGLQQRFGQSPVSFVPNEALEAAFGRYPPLRSEAAEQLGLCHDGSLAQLIERTLNPL
ncbi:NAD-dependent epimerase/dehydratase family protein [Pseudomonas massiliensis]|uniref:NAD-dependent epimerase/dehydratase family protein n=1 Tax=Pseudomonas massiliensis TaxID=522492 RepID=UPI00058ED576|nr:NAD-dependent epimerase/dehydratase family protein [Pseudomonas massiliensis]